MRRLLNLEVILRLLCVVALFLYLAGVEGCAVESKPSAPDASEVHCWNIPPQYGGGTYCSDEEAEGNHGYVNPGSMEWEVE